MRRTVALMMVLGLFAGLGCKHIGGKCDCQANEQDAVMPAATTPYPAAPMATVPATAAPVKMPPMTVVPPPAR